MYIFTYLYPIYVCICVIYIAWIFVLYRIHIFMLFYIVYLYFLFYITYFIFIYITFFFFAVCVVRKRSASWPTAQSWAFLAPKWAVQVHKWSPSVSILNLRHPETANGFSATNGIWAPMEVEKNVCQRLADQDSSRRWGLICPSHKKWIKKGGKRGKKKCSKKKSGVASDGGFSTGQSTFPTCNF